VVAPFALLSPATGILASAVIFGERFDPLRAAGMALILAGLAVIIWPVRRSSMAPQTTMEVEDIRRRVLVEIGDYRYAVPQGALGHPWSPEKIENQLQQLRSALVAPYWVQMSRRDTYERAVGAARSTVRRCAIVADDGAGNFLAFDPIANEFLLAAKHDDVFESFGVTGDAVGCFMAR
jgi:hypothetical protein